MAQAGLDLQDMISGLGSGNDWDALEDLMDKLGHPERKRLAEEDKARKEADKAAFRRDLLVIFSIPEGRRVLNRLVGGTIGRPPVNYGTLGLSADQVGVMAAYRNGQDTIIHALLSDLAEAGFDPSENPENGDAA